MFLVMTALLIYLLRFFSGLFLCVGGGDEYTCRSMWEMCVLLMHGDTVCRCLESSSVALRLVH